MEQNRYKYWRIRRVRRTRDVTSATFKNIDLKLKFYRKRVLWYGNRMFTINVESFPLRINYYYTYVVHYNYFNIQARVGISFVGLPSIPRGR